MSETALAEKKVSGIVLELESISSVTKKIKVTIPEQTIKDQFQDTLASLRKEAVVPGFRRGRVPNRILEKKLGTGLNDDVKSRLLNAAFQEAVEQHSLKPLGDPEISPESLDVPKTGPMEFTIQIEVTPEFPLPDLASFEIKKPVLAASDERFDMALNHLRRSLGAWAVTTDPAITDDRVQADVSISTEDGTSIVDQKGAILVVAPGSMAGVRFEDLGEKLTGVKAGDEVTLEQIVPDTHLREELRGRKFIVKIHVNEVSRLNMPELTEELARENGFESLEDLHNSMRSALSDRLASESAQAMRDQLSRQLVETIQLELPPRLTDGQKNAIFKREAIRLIESGMTTEAVTKHLPDMMGFSQREAEVELQKLFIISRLAELFHVTITGNEVNAAITELAMTNGERPEVLRRELQKSDKLEAMAMRMREHKVLDRALEQCKITEVDEAAWKQFVTSQKETLAANQNLADTGANAT